MQRHLILASAALVALTSVACSDDDDDAAETSATTSSTAAPSQAATTTTVSSPAGAQIVLAPDGLGVVEFGAATEDAVKELDAALGPGDGSVEPDMFRCEVEGQTDHQWLNLRIHVRDGKFVAWSLAATAGPGIEEAHDLHTPEGLGTGDYVSDLRKAYPAAEISEGADIAGHFSVRSAPGQARHLWGYLTGTGDTDLVDTIFGGDCGPDPTL